MCKELAKIIIIRSFIYKFSKRAICLMKLYLQTMLPLFECVSKKSADIKLLGEIFCGKQDLRKISTSQKTYDFNDSSLWI